MLGCNVALGQLFSQMKGTAIAFEAFEQNFFNAVFSAI